MVGDSKCVHPSASTCIRMANICIDWPSLIHCNLFAEIELGSHGRHNGRLGNQRLKYGSNGVRLTHCSRPTQEVKQTMASMCLGGSCKRQPVPHDDHGVSGYQDAGWRDKIRRLLVLHRSGQSQIQRMDPAETTLAQGFGCLQMTVEPSIIGQRPPCHVT